MSTPAKTRSTPDREFQAIRRVTELLETFDHDARDRIIGYVTSRIRSTPVQTGVAVNLVVGAPPDKLESATAQTPIPFV